MLAMLAVVVLVVVAVALVQWWWPGGCAGAELSEINTARNRACCELRLLKNWHSELHISSESKSKFRRRFEESWGLVTWLCVRL